MNQLFFKRFGEKYLKESDDKEIVDKISEIHKRIKKKFDKTSLIFTLDNSTKILNISLPNHELLFSLTWDDVSNNYKLNDLNDKKVTTIETINGVIEIIKNGAVENGIEVE